MKYIFLFIICTIALTAQDSLYLENIINDPSYSTRSVPGFRFLKDGRHYSDITNNTIEKIDITTGETSEVLFDANNFPGSIYQINDYTFSNDEQRILISTEKEPIYRRSSLNRYWVYDRQKKSLVELYSDKKQVVAAFSPDGSKVGFVIENDLYYKDLESGKVIRVSIDGQKNAIINGLADWVYEEEFSLVRCFEWSPDGDRIAFIRFDERQVPEFTLTNYHDNTYPEYVTFKYPKVGEANSKVSVHIYDLKRKKTVLADIGSEQDIYIPRIKWTSDPEELCVFKLTRHQNHLQLMAVDVKKGKSSIFYEEKSKYYIDIHDNLEFLPGNEQFIWTSEKNGYNHIYLISKKDGLETPVTTGQFDITNYYGYDPNRNLFYYQSAKDGPLQRGIYAKKVNGEESVIAGGSQNYAAQFSSTFDYYVLNKSAINMPPVYTVNDQDHREIRLLEDNRLLQLKQEMHQVRPQEFFSFKTSSNIELNGWILKPAHWNDGQKRPVLMFLYGGPGSQEVQNTWRTRYYWWFQYLVKQGYIVACVDNRGTGSRGEEFKKMTYLQLGNYETLDQIEAAKYIGSLDFVDSSRIAIFGWSYGGYMSSLCLLKGNDVFKAAIAVAPVTNWKWYDTIYTERYMRTLKENPDGYRDNSPVYFADRLKGAYLLIHGLGDDNVHFQHTAEMANALIAANKQFETYFYPNQNHGISRGNARLHLFQKMTNFLNEKL